MLVRDIAKVSFLGLVILMSGSAFSCSGDKKDAGGTAGSGNEGTGVSGVGGNTTGFADPTCMAVTLVNENPLLTDFSEVAAGDMNSQTTWGTIGLTGGVFLYQAGTNDPLTVTNTDEAMAVTGIIPAGSYAGVGFWFGPPCNDASRYSGIRFAISGDPGNTQIQLQLQSSQNYPMESSKGECEGKWDDGSCVSNYLVIEGTNANAQVISVPWASFTGGVPVDPVNPRELVGVQWHFNCGTDGDCIPNVTIDDVTFY